MLCHIGRPFYLTGIKFMTGAENKGCLYAVENNHNIFDDVELQLTARVKVKTSCDNPKTSM